MLKHAVGELWGEHPPLLTLFARVSPPVVSSLSFYLPPLTPSASPPQALAHTLAETRYAPL